MNDGTLLRKRSVRISGHATSVSLEEEFWAALKTLSVTRGMSMNALIGELDKERTGNLSSAIRVYVLREIAKQT